MSEQLVFEQEVWDLWQRWVDGSLAGDADALDALMMTDFSAVLPTGHLLNRSQFLDSIRTGQMVITAIRWGEVDLRVHDRWAIMTGLQSRRADYLGFPIGGDFGATYLFSRADDGWKVAVAHHTPFMVETRQSQPLHR